MSRPDVQGVRLLYDLARNYESRGDWQKARDHYEFVLTWDVAYRDALRRLNGLNEAHPTRPYTARLDYTGMTVSMLGPDVPRDEEVDTRILGVLAARLGELHVARGERARSVEGLKVMAQAGTFDRARRKDLLYDTLAYLKYEHAPAEDVAKKHLEMMNLVAEVDLKRVNRSLDIGTATCRYPGFFRSVGIDAYGVDVSAEGFRYTKSRVDGVAANHFVQGDGRYLPFADASFDLVTCMMGTINHIEPTERAQLLAEAHRVLQAGGQCVLGVWDSDCSYQSYLTMYSESDRADLRRKPVSRLDIIRVAGDSGFRTGRIIRFCCFPDDFVYDLRLDATRGPDIERMLDIDMSVRGRFIDLSGQMFLAVLEV